MKVKLESGEVLIAEWVELWHENNAVLIGTGDEDGRHYEARKLTQAVKEKIL